MVGLELLLGSWSIFSAEIAAFIRIPFRRCKWNVNDAFRKWETNMEGSEDALDPMPWKFAFLNHSHCSSVEI